MKVKNCPCYNSKPLIQIVEEIKSCIDKNIME